MEWDDYDAALFDLDGVLTPTAEVHMRAWDRMFNDYLAARASGTAVEPYTASDYFAHVDGKPRFDGVRAFLASRGIELPDGSTDDPPDAETVGGLGNRKNEVFAAILREEGVAPYPASVRLLDHLASRGTAVAVVSSSRNAPGVLAAAGLADRFEVVVDGQLAAAEGLAGKPSPATYLRAAEMLGVGARRCVVLEDALSGVASGRAGAFGLVVGVDRGAGRQALVDEGADVVVAELDELVPVMRRELHGSADPVDRTRFPVDEWAWRETWYTTDDLGLTETAFAVGNGYLGMRGNVEEGRDVHAHGTFINGFHETWQIRHAEEAFGFAQTGQTIVNVPDVKTIKVYVDDEPLMLSMADLTEYDRTLDFRDGVLRRSLVWRTPSGKRVRIDSSRMVSFEQRHLAVMTFDVTLLDQDAPVAISSQILNRQDGTDDYHVSSSQGFDPRRASKLVERVLDPQSHWTSDRRTVLSYRCVNSGMTLAVGVDHEIATECEFEELSHAEADLGKKIYRVKGRAGQPIRITKVAAYHTSRGVPTRELVDRARRTLDRVRDSGVGECFAQQRQWLDRFWADSDVEVEGHPAIQQAVRWNLFQLAQASGRIEQVGIPAKGVSGSGYEGHYFWDAETYVLPFLSYTSPWVARGALRFRYLMLPAARRRAAELSNSGALYPWRTINGEEASAYYAAGTAQYHINADIAFALCKYVQASGDDDFMTREGIDILVETARMWTDLGFWLGRGDARRFHLHGVTGPDEYTTVVNNNLFTNVMAKDNLRQAARWTRRLEEEFPDAHQRLVTRLDLADDEVEEWAECAEGMHIPFDEGLRVHPQDQHFLEREVWDLAATPDTKRPLLLHYHPLVIYRFQVLKQADVVAALFLQGQMFTHDQKRADFEYYDPLTTGDSTLSSVVQSIVAAEVGYRELAIEYFHDGLFVDLADLHGNAADGVHVASTGGVWNALVYGFGGMRDHNGTLTFDPRLPVEWPHLTFRIMVRGSRLRVELDHERICFTLRDGNPLEVSVRGQQVCIGAGEPTAVPLHDMGPVIHGRLGSLPLVGSSNEHEMVYTAGVPDPDRQQRRRRESRA